MTEFFTWQMLATQAGATIATALLTQALKGALQNIPTRLLSYVLALVVLLAANFFSGTLDVASGFLLAINAVVVSLASNGGFDVVAGSTAQTFENVITIDSECELDEAQVDKICTEIADTLSERLSANMRKR